jgi:hypothetical protein
MSAPAIPTSTQRKPDARGSTKNDQATPCQR